jgi:hypothetical protein
MILEKLGGVSNTFRRMRSDGGASGAEMGPDIRGTALWLIEIRGICAPTVAKFEALRARASGDAGRCRDWSLVAETALAILRSDAEGDEAG